MPEPTGVIYFTSPAAFRAWLAKNHAKTKELWVGYYRKGTGRPSLTWQEAVDEALCYGWIDGVRKSVDEERFVQRFTPRKPKSNWSAINVGRVKALIAEKRMAPAGLAAFEKRDEKRTAIYAYENRPKVLAPESETELRRNAKAAAFFDALPPAFKKLMIFYVMGAKKEETQRKRLKRLIDASAAGKRL
jgi:uncharacterized protein YdeI (YjbR/CyaY-like superfamily)